MFKIDFLYLFCTNDTLYAVGKNHFSTCSVWLKWHENNILIKFNRHLYLWVTILILIISCENVFLALISRTKSIFKTLINYKNIIILSENCSCILGIYSVFYMYGRTKKYHKSERKSIEIFQCLKKLKVIVIFNINNIKLKIVLELFH